MTVCCNTFALIVAVLSSSIAKDTSDMDSTVVYPEEFHKMLAPGGMPIHFLLLKIGTPLVLVTHP